MFVLTGVLFWMTVYCYYFICFYTTRPTRCARIRLPPKLTRTWLYSKRPYSIVLKKICESNSKRKHNHESNDYKYESRYTFYVKYK